MLKNKTIFKSIAVALIMVMMVAALSPSVGMVYAAHDPQNTQVEYSVAKTDWTFSVPAAQDFNKNAEENADNSLALYGEVAIKPVDANGVIVLPNNQTITITFTATNGYNNTDNAFELRNGSNSAIPYQIGKVTDVSAVDGSKVISYYTQNENNNVLTYIAGNPDYSNRGLSRTMAFTTNPASIKKAKVTGPHTDTLTFTVNVSGGTSGGGSESGGSTTTPTLISFTIESTSYQVDSASYQAEEGMTWEQWINSDYNNGENKLKVINGHVSTGSTSEYRSVMMNKYDFVSLGDTINATKYYWSVPTGGSN